MLKIGRDHLICVVLLIDSVETWKRGVGNTWSLVQICCIVEMIAISSHLTHETRIHWEIKTNTTLRPLEIHGPCFHAFLVLNNPLWCLEGSKINYSFQNWQTTLRTPEHILDFSSVSVSTAQNDREVFERGHSWNVNTQKESSIHQSPGLCHASIFHFSFFCVYSCEADRRWNLAILLLSALVPCFVHRCGLSSPCIVFGQCFSDLHPYNDTSILLCRLCEIPLHVFLRRGGISWIMMRTCVP